MKYTILPNGNLKITASPETLANLREIKADNEDGAFGSDRTMYDIFERLVCNSELEWVYPEEVGALTDAPMLGILGDNVEAEENDTRRCAGVWEVNGKHTSFVQPVEKVWAFMNYCVTSPQDVLAEEGYVIFESGNDDTNDQTESAIS